MNRIFSQRQRQIRKSFLNSAIQLVKFGLLGLIGCQSSTPLIGPQALPSPVAPITLDALETLMDQPTFDNCVLYQGRSNPEDSIDKIILGYINFERDFRPPFGPDGFVLRVIPLNQQSMAENVGGDILIRLLDTRTDTPRVVRAWHIPVSKKSGHWTRTGLLDCYFLRLDWGETALPAGSYRFQVMLKYQQQSETKIICTGLSIENYL